tara:strand:+ start:35 stop:658 length:624 start_codon:yes stop_codon:yes gene_type:complete
MKIALIDYQASNLYSIYKSIKDLGSDPYICNDPKNLKNADKIILPGVGSFAKAMKNIVQIGFLEEITNLVLLEKRPLLGICLGMQLLTESSTEDKFTKGLSFIKGNVENLKLLGCKLKLPHIGWNSLNIKNKSFLFKDILNNSDFYFANSFAINNANEENIIAKTNYDIDIISVIKKENIIGAQFHPEKSSSSGKAFLKNFLEFKYD